MYIIVRRRAAQSVKPHMRRLILVVAAVAIVLAVAVPVTFNLRSSHSNENSAAATARADLYSYFSSLISVAKRYNQYVVDGVPTTVVFGTDGRPVAVVQGAVPDAGFWRSLLSSSGGRLLVYAGATVYVDDVSAVGEVERIAVEACKQFAGVEDLRSIAVVFGSSLCQHCRHLKELFGSNGIRYVFLDLATNTAQVFG